MRRRLVVAAWRVGEEWLTRCPVSFEISITQYRPSRMRRMLVVAAWRVGEEWLTRPVIFEISTTTALCV